MKRHDKYVDWPSDAIELPPDKVVALYAAGFRGAKKEPAQHEALIDAAEFKTGSDAAHANGWAGSGAGKLILPWMCAWEFYPECWPGPAQTTGDCVSHNTKNCGLLLLGVEIKLAQPDPVTGVVEGPPEVSDVRQGVIATENIYGERGHGGAGASCDRLARAVSEVGGLMLRKPYPELGLDFTRYDASTGIRWGRSGVPQPVRDEGKKHQIRTVTELNTEEEVRDFLDQGYGVGTCSSLGFSSTRDENGVSKQRGSWAHAQALIGYDDRPWTREVYGEPLVLWLNSWGRWNSGPRRIKDTTIDIPEGSYWVKASIVRRASLLAFSNVNGWPARKLPDFGTGTYM